MTVSSLTENSAAAGLVKNFPIGKFLVKDISLHLLDILENSAKAGASLVIVDFAWSHTVLALIIIDDGPGLPDWMRNDPVDPYHTTRTTRKVGLGLPFLNEAATQTGGSLKIIHPPEGGIRIEATFDMSHIDAKPLGDLADALLSAILSWPSLDLIVRIGGNAEPVLDTCIIKSELHDIPLTHQDVRKFIHDSLALGLEPLINWADSVSFAY